MFNNPINRDLDRISLLESRDLVLRAFKSLHQRELGANKATEILSHLSQGSSYNKAAEVADKIVRPLLQYYSVSALSRATILLLSPNLREASLPARHGLNAVGWKQHLNTGGSWLEARIRVTEGTFSLFGEVTSNKHFIEIYDNPTNKYLPIKVLGSTKYPNNFEFSVGDLIRRIPDLTTLYEAIVENPASNWMCNISDNSNSLEMRITSNHLGMPKKDAAAKWLNIHDDNQIEEISTNYFGYGSTAELKVMLNPNVA
ncbi:hypothetical protein PITCH_A1750002 [uncultured Desulfobacterium sp.]|uniref:Uncharacterized protein n=1 Tax=uncultured Desulfobacterium sp. TaxID=201089 RepID=A0A445MV44_9BACT|nr:hypothetical protein PITCH_A1750002 [uncultured Desulfobacterium sp.]